MLHINKMTKQQVSSEIKHRNGVQKYFITFPHSTVSKEQFTDDFMENFETKKYITVAEKHEDGTPHLHLYALLAIKVPKSKVLEYMKKTYPDNDKRIKVESARSEKLCIEYLTVPKKNKFVDPNPYHNLEQLPKAREKCNVYEFFEGKFSQLFLDHIEDDEAERFKKELSEMCPCSKCRAEQRFSQNTKIPEMEWIFENTV